MSTAIPNDVVNELNAVLADLGERGLFTHAVPRLTDDEVTVVRDGPSAVEFVFAFSIDEEPALSGGGDDEALPLAQAFAELFENAVAAGEYAYLHEADVTVQGLETVRVSCPIDSAIAETL